MLTFVVIAEDNSPSYKRGAALRELQGTGKVTKFVQNIHYKSNVTP